MTKTIKGYYAAKEVHSATKRLHGYTEVLKRNGRWEHAYPIGNRPEIRIVTEQDYLFEMVNFADVQTGLEYTNMAGAQIKIIFASDAADYPMPQRW